MGGFYHEDIQDSSLKIEFCDRLDRGLAYGEACFETFRVVNGEVFSRHAHIARLRLGLEAFGIRPGKRQIAATFDAAVKQAVKAGADVLVRLTISGGPAPWGLDAGQTTPRAYVQLSPSPAKRVPARLSLRPWPFPPRPRPAKFTADYAETLRALGGLPAAEALFYHQGRLLSAATANVLLYIRGAWLTPAGDGILSGVVRGFLMQAGLLRAEPLDPAALEEAEAMLLCNSGSFLLPVSTLKAEDGSVRDFDPGHAAIMPMLDALAGCAGVPEDLGGW